MAQVLIRRAAHLYQHHPADKGLPAVAFALDSSIISLALNLFPWGCCARSRQAALKLHLLLSLRNNLPAWAAVTAADLADQKALDQLPVLAGACYLLDRGSLDFRRLWRLHQARGWFVVRNKWHVQYRVCCAKCGQMHRLAL